MDRSCAVANLVFDAMVELSGSATLFWYPETGIIAKAMNTLRLLRHAAGPDAMSDDWIGVLCLSDQCQHAVKLGCAMRRFDV